MKTTTNTARRIRNLTAIGLMASLVACGASDDNASPLANQDAPDAPSPEEESAPTLVDGTSDALSELETNACAELACGGQTCSDGICNAMLWTAQLYGDYDGELGDVAVAPDGDVLMVGSFDGEIETPGGPIQSVDGPDVFVAKMAWSGELRWVKRFGDAGAQHGTSIDVRDDGLIAIGGELEGGLPELGIEASGTDGFVAMLDQEGMLRWATTFGDAIGDDGAPTGDEHQTVAAVSFTPNGGVAVGGNFYGVVSIGTESFESMGEDSFVAQLDETGNVLSQSSIAGDGDERLTALAVGANGSLYVGGSFTGSLELPGQHQAQAYEDVFVAAIGPSDDATWAQSFHSDESARLTGLSLATDGELVITGVYHHELAFGEQPSEILPGEGSSDGFLARLTSDEGMHLSSRMLGGSDWEQPTSVSVHGDDVAVVGSFSGTMNLDAGAMTSVQQDAFVGALDGDFNGAWSQRYGVAKGQIATSVTHASDGAIVFGGHFEQGIDLGEGMLSTNGYERGVFVAVVAP